MCCLTIYKTKDDKLIITHNRDEQKSRHVSANQIVCEMFGDKGVWMPKDKQSRGTWIATDGHMAGALINGFKENHIKKTTYKASRGTIIPSLFLSQNVDRFIDEFDPHGYEPFTLLIIEKEKGMIEYGWNEQEVHLKNLDTNQSYIYSSSTLYNEEVMKYREQLFFEWLKNDCSENDIWHLHALKGNDHGHFLNVNYNAEISTVALSQIVLGKEAEFHYQSILKGTKIESVKLF